MLTRVELPLQQHKHFEMKELRWRNPMRGKIELVVDAAKRCQKCIWCILSKVCEELFLQMLFTYFYNISRFPYLKLSNEIRGCPKMTSRIQGEVKFVRYKLVLVLTLFVKNQLDSTLFCNFFLHQAIINFW